MDKGPKKRKGGVEKVREKKKKNLEADVANFLVNNFNQR